MLDMLNNNSIYKCYWKELVLKIVKIIITCKNINNKIICEMRDIVHAILVLNINIIDIFRELMIKLILNIKSTDNIYKIINNNYNNKFLYIYI